MLKVAAIADPSVAIVVDCDDLIVTVVADGVAEVFVGTDFANHVAVVDVGMIFVVIVGCLTDAVGFDGYDLVVSLLRSVEYNCCIDHDIVIEVFVVVDQGSGLAVNQADMLVVVQL